MFWPSTGQRCCHPDPSSTHTRPLEFPRAGRALSRRALRPVSDSLSYCANVPLGLESRNCFFKRAFEFDPRLSAGKEQHHGKLGSFQPAAKGGSFLLETPAPQDVFTPADLTDDQRLIGQTAEEFVIKEVFPHIKDLEEKKPGLMAELTRKAAELGLMSGGTPEEYGGAGLDKIASTVLTEKISIYGGFATTHGAHAGIGTLPIVYFGTEAQKKKYLPKLASGEFIGAYCLSEPQAGSDAQNLLTRAELSADGSHYILNGQKMWITNGGFADLFIVFAKVNGEKLTAFIVEKNFPGCKPGNEEHKMGIHGSSTTPVFLENCKVPKENLLHEVGRGHIVAFNVLNAGR